MLPWLTLSIIRYASRVKWSNPGNGVVPSPTSQCSSYWKGSLWVTLNYGCKLYLLIIITSRIIDFSHQLMLMVFQWSLSDSKSLQVSRTLLSILAVFNNAVIWMISTCLPTSKSSSPFSNPIVTVPKEPITIGIIVTCMFHSFFNSLAKSRYLSFFSYSFSFILWLAGTEKPTFLQVFFFLLIIIRSGLQAEIRWSVCMSKSHRSLCVSFSRTGAGLCIYHLFVWSNLNFLHISQWITLLTHRVYY